MNVKINNVDIRKKNFLVLSKYQKYTSIQDTIIVNIISLTTNSLLTWLRIILCSAVATLPSLQCLIVLSIVSRTMQFSSAQIKKNKYNEPSTINQWSSASLGVKSLNTSKFICSRTLIDVCNQIKKYMKIQGINNGQMRSN